MPYSTLHGTARHGICLVSSRLRQQRSANSPVRFPLPPHPRPLRKTRQDSTGQDRLECSTNQPTNPHASHRIASHRIASRRTPRCREVTVVLPSSVQFVMSVYASILTTLGLGWAILLRSPRVPPHGGHWPMGGRGRRSVLFCAIVGRGRQVGILAKSPD